MEQNTDTTLKWSNEPNRWNKPKQSKAYQIAIVQIVLSMIKICRNEMNNGQALYLFVPP